jgi:two-component system cell cycle response regulator DivK
MSKTILIVDDMEMNREITARILKIHGYNTLLASDGQEAIEISLKELPDLILMDMGLPVMDGWEATRIIKKTDSTKQIPIIALSAHAMDSYAQKAVDAGCNDYEAKPIDITSLVTKIKRLIVE